MSKESSAFADQIILVPLAGNVKYFFEKSFDFFDNIKDKCWCGRDKRHPISPKELFSTDTVVASIARPAVKHRSLHQIPENT